MATITLVVTRKDYEGGTSAQGWFTNNTIRDTTRDYLRDKLNVPDNTALTVDLAQAITVLGHAAINQDAVDNTVYGDLQQLAFMAVYLPALGYYQIG